VERLEDFDEHFGLDSILDPDGALRRRESQTR
jgi:hypothetical protein